MQYEEKYSGDKCFHVFDTVESFFRLSLNRTSGGCTPIEHALYFNDIKKDSDCLWSTGESEDFRIVVLVTKKDRSKELGGGGL